MERGRWLLGGGVLVAVWSPAAAAQTPDWNTCGGPLDVPVDARIGACTSVIESAGHNRGDAYARKGLLDRAIQDFDEALRLWPGEWHILDSRALVHLRAGHFSEALADYDALLRLEPQNARWLYGRGVARRSVGDAMGSQADIAAATAITPDIAKTFARYGVK